MGIHERSSREKISHVMNGAAHVMNDEATRKYLQVALPHHMGKRAGLYCLPIQWLCLACLHTLASASVASSPLVFTLT